jgi:hypothetical protein
MTAFRSTKEFHELRLQFEKDMKASSFCRYSLERDESGASKHYFYNDGNTNALFHAYMLGYQNAKCLMRLGLFD